MGWRLMVCLGLVVSALSTGKGEAGPPAPHTYRAIDAQGNPVYSDRPIPLDALRAPAEGAADVALVHELFHASGVDRRLPGLAARLRAELQRQAGLAAPSERQTVSEIITRHFGPETLDPLVRDGFLRAATVGRAREALAWYRSPLGQRIVALETQAATPESEREIRVYAATIGTSVPGSRVILIRRLDDASAATETGLDALVAMLRGFATTVDAARAPDRRMDRSQFEIQLRQTRERAFGPTRQGALVAMLYVYRELTEPELERYARFMESDAGSWYLRSLNHSLVRALGIAAERTGAEFVRVLPPERWQGAAQRTAGPAR